MRYANLIFQIQNIIPSLQHMMQFEFSNANENSSYKIELKRITYYLYYEIIVFMYLSLSTNVQMIGIFIMRSTHFIFPYHPILLPPAKHFPHRQLVLCRAFMECDEIIFSCLFLQETTFENLP